MIFQECHCRRFHKELQGNVHSLSSYSSPSLKKTGRSTTPYGRVEESLNARRILHLHDFKSCFHKPNIMKSLMYISSHKFPSSMRIPDSKWFVIVVVTTNRNVALGVLSTFSWSRNPKIYISFPLLLICIVDLREFYGVGFLSLGNFPPIKSTTEIKDDPKFEESKVLLKIRTRMSFFILA